MRVLNPGSRIPDPESRIPNFESRLSRSPSTNSDQGQLTVEKWISYICSTRLIRDVTPDLVVQGSRLCSWYCHDHGLSSDRDG